MKREDRTVHAGLPGGGEIARYDRAGKYYLEWPPATGRKRRLLSLKEAVELAESHVDEPGGFVALGRYGGQSFDARYLKWRSALAMMAPEARTEWRPRLPEDPRT